MEDRQHQPGRGRAYRQARKDDADQEPWVVRELPAPTRTTATPVVLKLW
ncbi:MAG: hypothetical protein ACOYOS_08080 [Syntrophales bacterium]